MIEITGELAYDSLDDGGEALIAEVDDGLDSDSGVWVRVVSNLGAARMALIEGLEHRLPSVDDHGVLAPLIGRRVRVTIEVLD